MTDTTDDNTPPPNVTVAPAPTETDAQKAVREAREAMLAPLKAITSSEAYQTIVDGLTELRKDFMDDDLFFAHIDALVKIMPRLKSIAE